MRFALIWDEASDDGDVDGGELRGIMVLLLKQIHLQNEVGWLRAPETREEKRRNSRYGGRVRENSGRMAGLEGSFIDGWDT